MSDPSPPRAGRLELLGVALVLAAHAAVSYALRDSYNFLDEAGYLENGRLWLRGWLPYVHYRDPHMPGIMVSTAAAFQLLGTSLASARALMAAVGGVTLLSTWWILRRLDRPAVAWGAMLLLAVLGVTGAHRGFVLLIEPFLTLAAVWCFYLLWRFRGHGHRLPLVGSGLIFGAALLFKQSYVFLLLPAPLLVWRFARARGAPQRGAWGAAVLWVAGAALPPALLLVVYAAGGHAGRLLQDTVLFHLVGPGWSTSLGIHPELHPYRYFLPYLVLPLSLILDRKLDRDLALLLGAFLFAGAMVAFPRFEFFHLHPMLPFLALLAARLLYGVASMRREATRRARDATFVATALLAAVFAAWWGTRGDPEYGRGFERQREVGQYVAERTPPGGTIFVFPMMPTISFYSGLPLATGNIDLEPSTLLPGDLDRVLAELERSDPLYVVYLPGTRFDDQPVEEWGAEVLRYLDERYVLETRMGGVFPGYCETALILRRKPDQRGGSGTVGGMSNGQP